MVHLLGTTNCPGRQSFKFVKAGIYREVAEEKWECFVDSTQPSYTAQDPPHFQNQEELSLVPGDSNSGLGLQVERGKQELGLPVRDKRLDSEGCREVAVYPGQL